MHIHITQQQFLYVWFMCSFINWFFLMGEYNHHFRTTLEHEKGEVWTILASLIAGVNGLIVTIVAHRGKHFAWRPLSQKEQDQLLMLKMLEDDSSSSSDDGYGGYIRRHTGVRVTI